MSSRKQEERNEKIIRGLMKLPPNRRCINCNSLGPQYVCTNFWTFVCMTCSGIHREFTHRVKSVSMSKFTSQEVEALQEGGNQRARETFLRDWDPREQRLPDNSNVDKVRDFIKSVYVDKKFFSSKMSGKPPRDMLNHRNHEDETRRASSYHSYSQSPPYDYQYEERRYGKQAPALTKKPGSDRGMMRFLSTSRLSDHVQEDTFANEVAVNARVSDYSVTNGGDILRSDSHSSGSGKFDGLDLFNAPNPPQPATSAPEKFGGLDLFSAPDAPQSATSAPGKFGGLDLFNAPNPPQPATSAPEKFSSLDLFNAPNPTQPATSAPIKFDGLDLFNATNPPQPATSAAYAEHGKFDGLDHFNAPNPPQPATSAPSAEPGKFDGLDLFNAPNPPQPATSAAYAEPGKFDGLDLFNATNPPQPATSAPCNQPGKFDGLDLFNATNPHQPATSAASAEPGKFDGLDLFNAPNPPQPATSAASAEPGKFVGLDVFELLDASSGPTLNVDQEFKAFGPDFDLFTVMPPKQSTETLSDKSTDGWATFDMPWHVQPSQQHVHDIEAPVKVNNNINNSNNNQSWSSFEESNTSFEGPLVADPYLVWGISEMKEADLDTRSTPFASTTEVPILDGAQSHGPITKSHNPFDFPSDTDLESSNMYFDMSTMQSALPMPMATPWFPDSAAIPFTSGKSQEAIAFMATQAPSMQIPNIQAQGPVASVGGNPFG